MDLTNGFNLNMLIGLAAMPVLIPLLVGHLKAFCRALHDYVRGYDQNDDSVWPMVADFVTVAWTVGLWIAHQLPAEVSSWPVVILLGFAISIAIQKGRDAVVSRTTSTTIAPPPTATVTLAPAADLQRAASAASPAPTSTQDPAAAA